MEIVRRLDLVNLVRELAENRVSALEILREALSNAKDHGAQRVFIASRRDPPNRVSLTLIDDGEGMDRERLEAFWGVGASVKPPGSIGYKGHGTKLFFTCARLSVATRSKADAAWSLTTLEQPLRTDAREVIDAPLKEGHPLWTALHELGLWSGPGTAISTEDLDCEDRAELLSRRHIESFCDWFTVIGDIRSGLFASRREFHRALVERSAQLDYLRPQDAELRPIEVQLRINGERDYRPIGLGRGARDHEFLSAWRDDVEEFQDRPGLLALGHRFADFHESKRGAIRIADDMSALLLTEPTNWTTDDGISIVAHVEGQRRQRQTYPEATGRGKRDGIYGFEQRNDLLRKVLDRALPRRAKFEIRSLRNWKVFVNDQGFRPTANRNDIANHGSREARIAEALEAVLRVSLREKSFSEWIGRLQTAALERAQNREIEQINDRREEVRVWMSRKATKDVIELADIDSLPRLDRRTRCVCGRRDRSRSCSSCTRCSPVATRCPCACSSTTPRKAWTPSGWCSYPSSCPDATRWSAWSSSSRSRHAIRSTTSSKPSISSCAGGWTARGRYGRRRPRPWACSASVPPRPCHRPSTPTRSTTQWASRNG